MKTCCNDYDYSIQTMFGSSWPTPVVCRWADFIFMACVHSGVQHVLNWWVTWRVSCKRQELLILRALRLLIFLVFCVVFFVWCVFVLFLVYPMLPVSLDCPFFIALRFSLTFIWRRKPSFHKDSTAICHLSGSLPCFFIRARETAALINWSLVACYKTNEYNSCFTE